MSAVALGDEYFVTSLRAVGVAGSVVHGVKEAEDLIDSLVAEGKCKVIFVTDRLGTRLERKRGELARRRLSYPVFAVVPEMSGVAVEKSDKLYRLISQAVGARLKLGEE